MSDTKKVVQDHFGKAAENYAGASIHALGEDLQWLVQAVELTGQESVLDVGTGAGHAAFAFAPHVKQVEGLDITPQMLVQAELGAESRNLSNVSFARGDVENIPRESESYDIVVSRWCAHHYVNIRLAMAEVARVLKPGGVFLLVDSVAPAQPRLDTFINTLEMLRDTGHVRNYSIAEWLALTELVGLHGMVLHEWSLRLDGLSWVERIGTPPELITAIRHLLATADNELRGAIGATDGDDWGFDLPAMLLKGVRV